MDKLKLLKELELHDLPIDSILFNVEENSISFKISKYNDDDDKYENEIIEFKTLISINSEKFNFLLFPELEISGSSAQKTLNGYYIILDLITRPSELNWQLSIECEDIIFK